MLTEQKALNNEISFSRKEVLPRGSHIFIVSDATDGSDTGLMSGIKTTLQNISHQLQAEDYRVTVIHPFSESGENPMFHRIPLPVYPEFKLAIAPPGKMERTIEAAKPNAY